MLPIETWSSCPKLVGIESAEAGKQSVLFSVTKAAEVYCGIINPEFKPELSVNNLGKPYFPSNNK